MTDILLFYDSQLFDDVLTVPEELLLTINIPLASPQTVFTLFEAKWTLMPYTDDPHSARKWNIEALCLAIYEDQLETPVLSSDQFERSLVRPCTEFVPKLFRQK